VLAVVIPVAAVLIAALTAGMIFGAYRHARVRSSKLLGGRGAVAIVGFVWLVVALTLGIGLPLRLRARACRPRSPPPSAVPRWSAAGRS
jgi:hypothetical protein